jgi:hypothetical protein
MQFLKLQEFIRVCSFAIILLLFTITSYSMPNEEDLKKISPEIFNIAIQVKSAFEGGNIELAYSLTYSALSKWNLIDVEKLYDEIFMKYIFLNNMIIENKSKLTELCS